MSDTRILIVDDEQLVLQGCARRTRLLRPPETVVFALGGPAAVAELERAEAAGAPFHAVVSDLIMPGLDGAALLELIHSRWPDKVRILLSGQNDLLPRATAPLAQLRFSKPAAIDLILEAIRFPIAFGRVLSPAERRAAQQVCDDYPVEQVLAEAGLPAHLELADIKQVLGPALESKPERVAALERCVEAASKQGREAMQILGLCIGISLLKQGPAERVGVALDSSGGNLSRLLLDLSGSWFGPRGQRVGLYLQSLWGAPSKLLYEQEARCAEAESASLCA